VQASGQQEAGFWGLLGTEAWGCGLLLLRGLGRVLALVVEEDAEEAEQEEA
jgi:hypothetical protein